MNPVTPSLEQSIAFNPLGEVIREFSRAVALQLNLLLCQQSLF